MLGVPFYGRAFKLENPHDSRMGARSRSTSFAGPYTREDGFLGYNEICEVIIFSFRSSIAKQKNTLYF